MVSFNYEKYGSMIFLEIIKIGVPLLPLKLLVALELSYHALVLENVSFIL